MYEGHGDPKLWAVLANAQFAGGRDIAGLRASEETAGSQSLEVIALYSTISIRKILSRMLDKILAGN
jgi:hypothetical protein